MSSGSHTPRISVASTLLLVPLNGCVSGAPSLTIFGAYFPGWLFCAVVGLLAAIGARVAFVTLGRGDVLPFQLFVCASIGLFLALLTWLLWFGA
jgi:hypothetical protein